MAEVVASEDAISESASIATALAVLAGIAASDAACCAALGRRSRSENHRDAQALLAEIARGGTTASKSLLRLLNLKDKAQYGLTNVSRTDLSSALRQAGTLVAFAERTLSR